MAFSALTALFRRSPALNGMRHRQKAVEAILKAIDPALVVETGTYKAHTTRWLAARARRVVTIELNPEFHRAALATTRDLANVSCLVGSSDDVFASGALPIGPGDRVVFYLDAHWNEHLPLRAELAWIRANVPNAVVVIDDFKVEGDPGYGFDDYGDVTGRLTLDYIRPAIGNAFRGWFPAARSEAETGKRRGWIVLARGDRAAALAGVSGLKPIPGLGA